MTTEFLRAPDPDRNRHWAPHCPTRLKAHRPQTDRPSAPFSTFLAKRSYSIYQSATIRGFAAGGGSSLVRRGLAFLVVLIIGDLSSLPASSPSPVLGWIIVFFRRTFLWRR